LRTAPAGELLARSLNSRDRIEEVAEPKINSLATSESTNPRFEAPRSRTEGNIRKFRACSGPTRNNDSLIFGAGFECGPGMAALRVDVLRFMYISAGMRVALVEDFGPFRVPELNCQSRQASEAVQLISWDLPHDEPRPVSPPRSARRTRNDQAAVRPEICHSIAQLAQSWNPGIRSGAGAVNRLRRDLPPGGASRPIRRRSVTIPSRRSLNRGGTHRIEVTTDPVGKKALPRVSPVERWRSGSSRRLSALRWSF
jgi:hypothetical protein